MVFLSACVRAVDVLLFVHVAQKGALASASEFEMAEPDGDSGFRSEYRLRKTDEFSSVFAFNIPFKINIISKSKKLAFRSLGSLVNHFDNQIIIFSVASIDME